MMMLRHRARSIHISLLSSAVGRWVGPRLTPETRYRKWNFMHSSPPPHPFSSGTPPEAKRLRRGGGHSCPFPPPTSLHKSLQNPPSSSPLKKEIEKGEWLLEPSSEGGRRNRDEVGSRNRQRKIGERRPRVQKAFERCRIPHLLVTESGHGRGGLEGGNGGKGKRWPLSSTIYYSAPLRTPPLEYLKPQNGARKEERSLLLPLEGYLSSPALGGVNTFSPKAKKDSKLFSRFSPGKRRTLIAPLPTSSSLLAEILGASFF